MRKTLTLKNSTWEENNLLFAVEGDVSLETLTPTGQMIVDSDQAAFVYLAENEDEYIYLYIFENDWANLKEALDKQARVYAMQGESELGLASITEELEYLVQNIEGNSNYGEELVTKVESFFL